MSINKNKVSPQSEEELYAETFKTHLDSWLCNLLCVTLPGQGGWTRLYPEVFSNPVNSMIL